MWPSWATDIYTMVPSMRELLDDLVARGIPMAVVSEWPPSLREFLAHHHLLRYFQVVVVTSEEGVLKPRPQLIHRALEALGLPAVEVVYIADHPEKDMEPAQALGLPTIHFNPKRTYNADCYETADLRARLEEMIR